MRRAAILIATLILLCGCGEKPQMPPKSPLAGHSGNYTATAAIYSGELEATATISQQTPEACLVTFQSPETIRDMSFLFSRDSVNVAYRGLGFSFDPASLPDVAAAKIAVGAMNTAMRKDGCVLSLTDTCVELKGTIEAGEFVIHLDAVTGKPLSLALPGNETEIVFTEFSFLD